MPTNEERLARMEATLEHMATKEDMQGLRAELIKWVVGTGIGAAEGRASLRG